MQQQLYRVLRRSFEIGRISIWIECKHDIKRCLDYYGVFLKLLDALHQCYHDVDLELLDGLHQCYHDVLVKLVDSLFQCHYRHELDNKYFEFFNILTVYDLLLPGILDFEL